MSHAISRMPGASLVFLALLLPGLACAQFHNVRTEPFSFSSEGAVLVGALYLPDRPIAGLVLVHGSGPATRMDDRARFLAERGFVVATWDKRGVGESGGQYEERRNTSAENLALLSGDAAAALNWISARTEVADLPVGYWGISQAGWIIPMAALQTPQVDFITLWSGPLCTVIEELEAGIGTGGNLVSDDSARDFIAELQAQDADTDPRDALRQLNIPGLWLFGGRDDTLPVDLSIERLSGLIEGGQDYFEYRLSPVAGHNMSLEADRPMVDLMVEWMQQRQNLR